ncbi:MAG: hypothetical protein CBB68_14785 [Rhodospirillaceae bacterium TMED8]|nr:hypothetical protein [Magnetovibrio sp.]OUT47697.1 MAG: hypothetical protein CBB68_14785 [Rhodospirillaceae bacterium TMED8]|tara:strand:+ start:38 stop:424 length:387 start_codon:yes stop_codon:yes gene_type:complete
MDKIELTVHEFMTVMGTLDEKFGGRQSAAPESIYSAWHEQWRALDSRLEKLGLMERADMLFDGKVAINALSEKHFRELIKVVQGRLTFNQQLIDEGDEDGDVEELEVWESRLGELQAMHDSVGWQNQD